MCTVSLCVVRSPLHWVAVKRDVIVQLPKRRRRVWCLVSSDGVVLEDVGVIDLFGAGVCFGGDATVRHGECLITGARNAEQRLRETNTVFKSVSDRC